MKRRECSLLPHIRTDLYGFNSKSMQLIPWALKEFKVQKAWNYSEGRDVVVGVIDTGCDINHDDIKDNLLPGKNIVDNNNNPQDDNGHGTHVAGTVAAINNGYGVVGVSPKTKILPVKVLDSDGVGSMRDVANGIYWAVDHGAEILTMSLGSPNASRLVEKAIEYANNNNVTVFCAAGNSGNHVDVMYPAKFIKTISIGAISRNLSISNFSCTGNSIDFVAPGEDIISCVPGNGYASMSGTSMATPYAVGCAALLLSLSKSRSSNLSIDKNYYINQFKKNAKPINGKHSGDRRYQGNGIIQPIYY